jgi:hypothetical protein
MAFGAAALALLALAAGGVHAEPIRWAVFGSPAGDMVGNAVWTSQLEGGVEFGSGSGGSDSSSADVDVLALSAFYRGTVIGEDFFDNAHRGDGFYTLSLELVDDFAGPRQSSGHLTFTGVIGGTMTPTTADLTNTFTGETTKSLWLNGNAYTVTIGPFVAPGPPAPGLHWDGRIGAHVEVRPKESPEPTGLALAGLGASLLGGAAWRAWRRRRAAAPAA